MKEYYKILNLPFWATDEEVKRTYRALVQELHPDKNNTSPAAEEKLKEINEAYSILGNAEKRREYDFNCIVSSHYMPGAATASSATAESNAVPPIVEDAEIISTHETSPHLSSSLIEEELPRQQTQLFTTDATEDSFAEPLQPAAQKTKRKPPRSYQQWKKILLLAIPIVAALGIIYLLLPSSNKNKKNEAIMPPNPSKEMVDNTKTFNPSKQASVVIKWQEEQLLYKLDLKIAVRKKPTYWQIRSLFKDSILVSFVDKDGFTVFSLLTSVAAQPDAWAKTKLGYVYTISDQVPLSYAIYKTIANGKLNIFAIYERPSVLLKPSVKYIRPTYSSSEEALEDSLK
jgi:curved DNA-binding protein CbpA